MSTITSRRSLTPARSIAAGLALALGSGVTLSASTSAAPPVLPVHQRPIAWTSQFGTADADIGDSGPRVGRSSNGDLYVAISTSGAFPGFVNAGNDDVFLRKFDKNGNVKWSRQFGSPGGNFVTGLAVTSGGDAYLTGYTTDDIDGAGPAPFSGVYDGFLARYDKNGNLKWIRQFGTPVEDIPVAVTTAGTSDVYLTGWTTGNLDGLGPAIASDGFVMRFDRNGNQAWVRQFRTASDDQPAGIAARGTSEIYVAGSTGGDLNGLPPDTSDSAGDAFLMRWDRNGNVVWARQWGAHGSYDNAASVAVSGTKDVWVSGLTVGDVDGAGPGPFGGADAFVSQWDRDGTSPWITQWGTGDYDDTRVVAATNSGALYVTGFTDGDIDDVGPGVQQGGGDLYLATLSRTTGAVTTIRQFGSALFEGYPYMVLTSSSTGMPFVAAVTFGTVTGHANVGGFDAVLTQFG